MSDPRTDPFPSRALRKQWEKGVWDLSEWDALVANFPLEIREQLQGFEKQDERERREEFGISAAETRQKWAGVEDGPTT